ncbi:Methyltransferase domain-containing protein [Actinopolyspora lacussalsi subsp. righensis]|uniref:Methyltransferase domain-containing protein n=1 Tax=Actinopolyspora righensis TaxID=995060 RepID=A0A1I6XHR0_9ACTN|nr:class I SAM-dependent methyltransferase [Actinopolyspora righensis]SFT37434.1 Methyltransferase domain-containing protein [Actinopolyspora righensis]
MARNTIYDQFAEAYALHSEHSPANAYYDRPAVLDLAGDVAGKRVLELGCAAGVLSEQLVERGAAVFGVDREPRMVELARRRLDGRAEFDVADLSEPLDLVTDSSTDLVVASLVLHYLADWEPLLTELNRCLVADGELVFSVHHPAADWQWFGRPDYLRTELVTETWPVGGQEVSVSFYRRPLSAVFEQLHRSGFVVDTIGEPRPLPELNELSPDAYVELSSKPVFLFVKAFKVG